MEPGTSVDFGFSDDKGRRLGFQAGPVQYHKGFTGTCRETGETFVSEPHYYVNTHATRGGKRFGASTRALEAATPEELPALIQARMEACRKRYAKKFAAK